MAGAQFWRESERESLCCWAKIAQEFLLDQMWSKQERELARSHDQFHTKIARKDDGFQQTERL